MIRQKLYLEKPENGQNWDFLVKNGVFENFLVLTSYIIDMNENDSLTTLGITKMAEIFKVSDFFPFYGKMLILDMILNLFDKKII